MTEAQVPEGGPICRIRYTSSSVKNALFGSGP